MNFIATIFIFIVLIVGNYLDKDFIKKYYIPYIFAYTLVMIGIYTLKLPTIITGDTDLVNEYYYQNIVNTFVLDFILIAAYLGIASGVMKLYNTTETADNMIIVMIVTICISGLFLLYFRNDTTSFFGRWFNAVGYYAIVYDVFLCVCVYVLYECFVSIINK